MEALQPTLAPGQQLTSLAGLNCVGVWLCRGEGARLADVSSFSHSALYPSWAVQPLSVAWAPARFAKCEMSASLLANDQASATGVLHVAWPFAAVQIAECLHAEPVLEHLPVLQCKSTEACQVSDRSMQDADR